MKYPRAIYEPEDDVLNIWLSQKAIDYAKDENGMIVHYTEGGEPVYVEILDATEFFNKAKSSARNRSSVAIAHKIK